MTLRRSHDATKGATLGDRNGDASASQADPNVIARKDATCPSKTRDNRGGTALPWCRLDGCCLLGSHVFGFSMSLFRLRVRVVQISLVEHMHSTKRRQKPEDGKVSVDSTGWFLWRRVARQRGSGQTRQRQGASLEQGPRRSSMRQQGRRKTLQ